MAAGHRTPRVGVKAIIVRDGQVLMNRYQAPDGTLSHELPGGGQEHGETQAEALVRECAEEIGARVEVGELACVFEFMAERTARDDRPIPLFHQVNVAYWCALAPGEEPRLGPGADRLQTGVDWLPLERLDGHDVRPANLVTWLRTPPDERPRTLALTRLV